MGIKGAFSKGFSQSARYYSRLIYLNSSAPFPSRVISIPIQKDKFHRVEVTSPATLHRHREMLANFYRCTRLSLLSSANNKTLLFTKPWIQKVHKVQTSCRYLSTFASWVYTHRSGRCGCFQPFQTTVPFKPWNSRNGHDRTCHRSTLKFYETYPLPPQEFIFLGFPISSLPS